MADEASHRTTSWRRRTKFTNSYTQSYLIALYV